MRQHCRKDPTFKANGCSQNAILLPSGLCNSNLSSWFWYSYYSRVERLNILADGLVFCGELSFLDFSRFNDARFLIEQKYKSQTERHFSFNLRQRNEPSLLMEQYCRGGVYSIVPSIFMRFVHWMVTIISLLYFTKR